MTPPEPHPPWPELLAAYADGELDPAARAAVERWLVANPEGRDELFAQHQLGPGNWELWHNAEPPQPSERDWARVGRAVADTAIARPTPPATTRPWRRTAAWLVGGLAAAAAVAWLAYPSPRHPSATVPERVVAAAHPTTEDPLAGIPVLPVATAADVDISRVAGTGGGVVVGDIPLPGPMVLAAEADVDVESAIEHPAWPDGNPKVVTAPGAGDAPMIFALRSSR